MNRELLRDVIVDGIENSTESKVLKRFCWTAMIIAVLYFGSTFAQMWAR
jgi:hypothetical protein